MSFAADYGVFEYPAKMKGDTLICEASRQKFNTWEDINKALKKKEAEGFHAVTGYWENYDLAKARNQESVYCIRVRPNTSKE